MIWLLGGYMWLYVHRPFEVWPSLGSMQIERGYMLAMILAWAVTPTKAFVANRIHAAVAFFSFALLGAWLLSPYANKAGCLEVVENFAKVSVFYVLVVTSVRDERGLRLLTLLFLAAVGLYMAHSMLEFLNGRYQWRMGTRRMIGVDITYSDPNAFASTLLYALPFTLPFWREQPRRVPRLLLAGFVLAAVGCILMTGSRAGLMGLCVLITMLFVGSSKSKVQAVLLCGAAGVLALLAMSVVLPEDLQNRYLTIVDSSRGPQNAHESGLGRWHGLTYGIWLWQASPVFGYGPATFAYASGRGGQAHNLYGQVLSEMGTVGALALLALLVSFWLNWREARRRGAELRLPEGDFRLQVARAVGLNVLLLLAMGCAGHNLFRYNWQWFAAFGAIATCCLRARAQAAPAARVAGRFEKGGGTEASWKLAATGDGDIMDRSFLKHAAVYGLAALFVQAGGFVLLPIYLRCLGPGDYGALEVVGRLAETVGTLLLFGGFRQALITFHQQAGDEPERRRVVAACYLLVAAAGLVGVVLAALAGPWLGEWLVPESTGSAGRRGGLVALAIAAILLEPFALLPLALLQARMQSIRYVLCVVVQFSFRLALCVLLVRVLRLGLAGALAASVLTGVVFAVALSGAELLRGLAWPRLEHLRGLLAFALPLLPGGVCFFVLHHGDRFFLLRHAGAGEVGTYALGYKLALAVGTFSLAPLYLVWGARMYDVARSPDAARAFGRVFTRALAVYLYAGLGLCLLGGEVILLLGGPEYSAALDVLPLLVLGCFCQSASSLMDAGLYVRRRTGVKLAVTAAATAVMLGLYAALIPPWGARGAAVATLGGFASLALATFFASQRVFPVSYEPGRLAGLLGLVGAAWLAGQALPGGWVGVGGKAGLLAAVPAVAWFSGLVRGDEKAQARAIVRSVFRVLASPRWGRWA